MPKLQVLLILHPLLAMVYAIYAFAPRAHRADKQTVPASLVPAIIPFLTALVIVYVFFISGVARTVQFNVNSAFQMLGWTLLVKTWWPLIVLNFFNGMASLIFLADLAIRKDKRLKFASACVLLSALGLATLYYNAPMA